MEKEMLKNEIVEKNDEEMVLGDKYVLTLVMHHNIWFLKIFFF